MRYIDNLNLLEVTNFLTEKELGLCIINGKLEAFSLAKKPSPLFGLPGLLGIKEEPVEFVSAPPVAPTTVFIKKERSSSIGIEESSDATLLHTLNPAVGSSSSTTEHPDVVRRRRSSSLGSYKIKKPLRNRATSLGDLSEPSTRKLLCDLISTLNEFFPDYDFESTKPEQFVNQDLSNVIRTVNSYLAELTEERSQFLERLWRSVDELIDLRHCEVYSLVPDMEEDPFSDGTLWSFNYFFFNYSLKQICYFTCVARSKIGQHASDLDVSMEDIDIDGYDDDMGMDQDHQADNTGDNENEEERDSDDDNVDMNNDDSLDEGGGDGPDWDGII